jgi:tetratricopeptide (TPR) repeat protein
MCQEAVRRLCNASESCHVRKVVRLLARPLSPTLYSLEDFFDRVLRLFDVFSEEELAQRGIEEQKKLVTEVLVAYRVLLILDNMETMNDGRLMEFVRTLPPESQSKVLLTSRRRTAEWEYPIRVTELDESEVKQLLQARSAELGLDLPVDDPAFVQRIKEMSGGLPLAIQWILGEYRKTNRLNKILSRALTPDSPLLEFSFRNSWNALEMTAQQALAVLSVFIDPPTAQEWRTTLDWSVDKMESAITSLIEATFVSERTEPRTGKVIYAALPITLTFARNELSKMGDLEREARLRYQGYRNRLELAAVETGQYSSLFEQYEAQTETQKKAIVLCRMAEGQAGRLGYEAADEYFKQAMGVEPRSVYTLVSYGQVKAELGRFGEAVELMERAALPCRSAWLETVVGRPAEGHRVERWEEMDRQNRQIVRRLKKTAYISQILAPLTVLTVSISYKQSRRKHSKAPACSMNRSTTGRSTRYAVIPDRLKYA